MQLISAGLGADARHIARCDAGAWQDLEPPGGVGDHLPHGLGAVGDVRLLPAGQDARDVQLGEQIDGLAPVGHHVDRTVENSLFPGFERSLSEDARAFGVDGPVCMQKAEDQPVRPVCEQQTRVFATDGKFRIRIAEAAFWS